MSERKYTINECFLSLQGEGVRAGTVNVFVRLSGCNQRCDGEWVGDQETGVFQPICDTEFVSGRSLYLKEIHDWILTCSSECKWLILTGGEPALQVGWAFINYFRSLGYKLAIETNGSVELPYTIHHNQAGDLHKVSGFDWVTVSPKVAEHAIKQKYAHEVKYVRGYGQGIPKTVIQAEHYLISPAFQGNELDRKTLDWCVKLCLENPKWRLSVQQHKQLFGGIR